MNGYFVARGARWILSGPCRTIYLLLSLTSTAAAHEFWIEPMRFQVSASESIVADLRVGQYFKGNSQVYLPQTFVAFTVTDPRGTRPVEGRIGDLPAVDLPAERNGLHVLAYHSTPSSITYERFEDFERFATKQGLEWAIDAHRRRGLPDSDIREAYTRYAKALVAVGNGAGADRPVGFPFELVAETNPYTAPPDEAIVVRLLRRRQPQPDAQVTIFRKFTGCEATRTTVRTDSEGRARIPRGPGGRFLINAVHLREPATDANAAWESLWASMTYELPAVDGGTGECETPADTIDRDVR